jgi:phosphohistidine phosphatase
MKTLYVLRHAKSSWDNNSLSDFDRPLNERGFETAPMMGEMMRENDFVPEIIVCSTAKRAEQTARLVKESAEFEAEIKFEKAIYEASPQTLLRIVSEIGDEFDSALIVGHNPGFENLVRVLTGKSETMPTAALAVIDLKIESWSEINADSGNLRKFIRPKEII